MGNRTGLNESSAGALPIWTSYIRLNVRVYDVPFLTAKSVSFLPNISALPPDEPGSIITSPLKRQARKDELIVQRRLKCKEEMPESDDDRKAEIRDQDFNATDDEIDQLSAAELDPLDAPMEGDDIIPSTSSEFIASEDPADCDVVHEAQLCADKWIQCPNDKGHKNIVGYIFAAIHIDAVRELLRDVRRRKHNRICYYALAEHMDAPCDGLFEKPTDHYHLLVYYSDCPKPTDMGFHRRFYQWTNGKTWKSAAICSERGRLQYIQCEPRRLIDLVTSKAHKVCIVLLLY